MFEKNENVQLLIEGLVKLYENEEEEETTGFDSLNSWFIENNEAVKLLLKDYSKIVSDDLNFVFSSNELTDVCKNQFRYDFIKYQSLVTTILNLEKVLYYMKNKSFFKRAVSLCYEEEGGEEKMIKENEALNFTYKSFARNCSYMEEDMNVPEFVVKCSFPIHFVFRFRYSDLEAISELNRVYDHIYVFSEGGCDFDNWI